MRVRALPHLVNRPSDQLFMRADVKVNRSSTLHKSGAYRFDPLVRRSLARARGSAHEIELLEKLRGVALIGSRISSLVPHTDRKRARGFPD